MIQTTSAVTIRSANTRLSTKIEGQIVFTKAQFKKAKNPILLRRMTEPEDEPLMRLVKAVLTIDGGPACHAAIVCTTIGTPFLSGLNSILKSGAKYYVNGQELKPFTECTLESNEVIFEL